MLEIAYFVNNWHEILCTGVFAGIRPIIHPGVSHKPEN